MQIISNLKSLVVGEKSNEKQAKLLELIEKCHTFFENNNAVHTDDIQVIKDVQNFVLELSKDETLNANTSHSLLSATHTRSKVYLLVSIYSIIMNHCSFTGINFEKFIKFLVNCKIIGDTANQEIKRVKDLDFNNCNSLLHLKEIKEIKKYFDEFINTNNVEISSNSFAKKYNTYNIKELKAKIVNKHNNSIIEIKDNKSCPISLAEKEHEEKRQVFLSHEKSKNFYHLIKNFLSLEIIKKTNANDIKIMLDNYSDSSAYFIYYCQTIFTNTPIINELIKKEEFVGNEQLLLNMVVLANIGYINNYIENKYIDTKWLFKNIELLSKIDIYEIKDLDKILSFKNYRYSNLSKQTIIEMFSKLKSNKKEKLNSFLSQSIYSFDQFDKYVEEVNKLDYIIFKEDASKKNNTSSTKNDDFRNIILENPKLIKYIEKLNKSFNKLSDSNIETLNKLKTFDDRYISKILRSNFDENTITECVNDIFDYDKKNEKKRNTFLSISSNSFEEETSGQLNLSKSISNYSNDLKKSQSSTDDEKDYNRSRKTSLSSISIEESLSSSIYKENLIDYYVNFKENVRSALLSSGFTLEYLIQNYEIIKSKINFISHPTILQIIKNALANSNENKTLILDYFINLDVKYLELFSNYKFINNLKNVLLIDIYNNPKKSIELLKTYPIENLNILSYRNIKINNTSKTLGNYEEKINKIFKENYNLIDENKQKIFNSYWKQIPESDKLILRKYLEIDINEKINKFIPKKLTDELQKQFKNNETLLLLNEFTESKLLYLITSEYIEELFELVQENSKISIFNLINLEYTGKTARLFNSIKFLSNEKGFAKTAKKLELLIRPFELYVNYKKKGDYQSGHEILEKFIKPYFVNISKPVNQIPLKTLRSINIKMDAYVSTNIT